MRLLQPRRLTSAPTFHRVSCRHEPIPRSDRRRSFISCTHMDWLSLGTKSPSPYPSARSFWRCGTTWRKVEHHVSRKMTACSDCLASIQKSLCLRRVNRGQVSGLKCCPLRFHPGLSARDEKRFLSSSREQSSEQQRLQVPIIATTAHLLWYRLGFWPLARWRAQVVLWQRSIPLEGQMPWIPGMLDFSSGQVPWGPSSLSVKPPPRGTGRGCLRSWWQRPLELLVVRCLAAR